jgi:hypothetical protein
MIVPFPPGGATDAIARIMHERLRAALGQTVIIENIGGAGGTIGVGRVAARGARRLHAQSRPAWLACHERRRADAELRPAEGPRPGVDGCRQSAGHCRALGLSGEQPQGADRLAQGQPGQGVVATVGAGSPSHVSAVYFADATGTRLNLVPYRGGGPAMQDLVANQVDLMIIQVAKRWRRRKPGGSRRLPSPPRRGCRRARHSDRRRGRLPGMYISFWHGCGCRAGAERHPRQGQPAVVETLADPAVQKRLAAMHQEIRRASNRRRRGLRLSEGGDREVVADHQGGGHQGGVRSRVVAAATDAGRIGSNR